ncbi:MULTISPECIES: hypothetical protein [Francisella]|uniref:Uncharacterized protein n=1 Tax=Francisella opportunistica TaxID=2016517 RepID=A0A345JQE3_9GAMM|nr:MULTISPECIES: hypothetical protein [Francisella]APC91241.1 hypothetical protein BBG19_0505 [Francisella sp. MA067296]AXH29539.1 hypothetical protein CGC43_02570 [Francisella opportunistica]AXH31190.1 hypothetical protein CGC44_02545 [Francisella opportunistica]AXH32837.1 hypothetical protein CGC45_02555 [Francisella opportunistica]
MPDYRVKNFFPKLNKKELEYLYKAIDNELQRWSDIINLNNSENGNHALAADYENDSLRLDNLLGAVDQYVRTSAKPEGISFSQRDTAYVIEALEHECELWKKGKSSFNAEEFSIIEKARSKIKELAIKEYGPKILELVNLNITQRIS